MMIPEEVGKGLDATKAVADTAGKALDTVNGIGGFLERTIGPPMLEVGGYLADRIAFGRRMQGLRFERIYQLEFEKLGLDPKTIRPAPLSLVYKVLEEASLEEAEEIQILWAKLLAKSVDPVTNFVATKMHISLIKELSPAEAVFLSALWQMEQVMVELTFETNLGPHDQVDQINCKVNAILKAKWLSFDAQQRDFAARNLLRLGCITSNVLELPDLSKLFEEVPTGGQNRYGGKIAATRINVEQFNALLSWQITGLERAAGQTGSADPQAASYRWRGSSHVVATLDAPETGFSLTEVGRDLVRAVTP
jgi:Abortive infection alpha